ncbi:MAG: hypothetical protein WBW81_12205 [Methylocella sp.]
MLKSEIIQAFGRLTKAEFFGQKIELREVRAKLVETNQVALEHMHHV